MRTISRICLALLLTLTSSIALAQEDAVAGLNAEGMQAFARGDYEEAADIFGRAYALEPRPELLKNAAIAWYKADRCDEALSSATTFLRTAPEPDGRQMQALVAACQVRLAQEAVAAGSLELAEELLEKAGASKPDEALVAKIDVLRVEIAKRRAAETEVEPTPVEVTPLQEVEAAPQDLRVEEPPPPRRGSAAGPIFVTAGGIVIAGTLTYHLVAALSLQPEFRRVAAAGVDRDRYNRLDRSLRLANVLVPVGYTVGVLSLGTGLTLWLTAGSEGDVAVSLRGTF